MPEATMTEVNDALAHATNVGDELKAELTSLESAEEVDKEAVKCVKAKIKTAGAVLKRAKAAVKKVEARIERESEKEAKVEAKAAEKKAKDDEKQAKVETAEAEKKAKAEAREAARMPEQNGIRRPKPGTKCGQVWELADTLSAKFGQPTPVKELLVEVKNAGMNEGNAKAEYARWRKFNGVVGRVSLPKAPEVAAEVA